MNKLKSVDDLLERFCWETGVLHKPDEHIHKEASRTIPAARSCYTEWWDNRAPGVSRSNPDGILRNYMHFEKRGEWRETGE